MAIDVSMQGFEELVLEGSRRQPIVVDFWAPWCGPCRQLTPVLEELEREAKGRWLLAKANVEDEPQLGQAFGISGIPALKAFRDGGIVAEKQGLSTKAELEEWLALFVPGPELEHVAAAREAETSGDDAKAETEYRAALALAPGYEDARTGLAGLLERLGRLEEAAELIEEEGGELAARIRLERLAAAGPELEQARDAAAAGGLAERHALAVAEAAAGRHAEALEILLALVAADREWNEEAARKTMLEIFQVLGDDSELVDDVRRKLSMLLY